MHSSSALSHFVPRERCQRPRPPFSRLASWPWRSSTGHSSDRRRGNASCLRRTPCFNGACFLGSMNRAWRRPINHGICRNHYVSLVDQAEFSGRNWHRRRLTALIAVCVCRACWGRAGGESYEQGAESGKERMSVRLVSGACARWSPAEPGVSTGCGGGTRLPGLVTVFFVPSRRRCPVLEPGRARRAAVSETLSRSVPDEVPDTTAPAPGKETGASGRLGGSARSRAGGGGYPRAIRSAAFSPMSMQVIFGLTATICGMIEASTTRRPSVPLTRSCGSSGADSSSGAPIFTVPTGW